MIGSGAGLRVLLLLPGWRCAHLQPGKKDKLEDITGALTNENLTKEKLMDE